MIIRPDFGAPDTTPPAVPGATPSGVPLPRFYYFPACVRSVGQHPWGALADVYRNNTCFLGQTSPYIFSTCSPTDPNKPGDVPRASANTFYAPHADIDIQCGHKTLSLSEAQAVGYDVDSTAMDSSGLSPSSVVALVMTLLRF